MTEILWHGRGGQGAFTAARLLGDAYSHKNGAYSLSFPSFGPERRGAPIRAFTKLADTPIGNRSEIKKADYSIYLDDTLLDTAAFDELKNGGRLLVNTSKKYDDPRIVAVDAGRIAREVLGLPITNTILLGIFAAVSGEVSLDDVAYAIKRNMPKKLHDKNIAAVSAAFREVGA